MESASAPAMNAGKCKLSRTSEHYQYQAKQKNPQDTRPIHFLPPQLRATAATTIIVGRISRFLPRKSSRPTGANHSATSQANYSARSLNGGKRTFRLFSPEL